MNKVQKKIPVKHSRGGQKEGGGQAVVRHSGQLTFRLQLVIPSFMECSHSYRSMVTCSQAVQALSQLAVQSNTCMGDSPVN